MILSSPINADISMMILPPIFPIRDLILLKHQFRRYVEHLFECEICRVHYGMTIVQVILSHEYC